MLLIIIVPFGTTEFAGKNELSIKTLLPIVTLSETVERKTTDQSPTEILFPKMVDWVLLVVSGPP